MANAIVGNEVIENSPMGQYYINNAVLRSKFVFRTNFNMFIEGQKFTDHEIYANYGALEYASSNLEVFERQYFQSYIWSIEEQTAICVEDAIAFFPSVAHYNSAVPDFCTYEYAKSFLVKFEGMYLRPDDISTIQDQEYDERNENDSDDWEEVNTRTLLREAHDRSNIDEDEYFTEVNWLETRPAIGIELEVYADNRSDTVGDIRDVYYDDELILEQDGSLDDYHGFEIVTRPFGFEEWQYQGPKLLKVLQKFKLKAAEEKGYGIHVNIHRRHFTPLAEARIFMFLCAEENAEFVLALAQRKEIYHADREMCGTIKSEQKVLKVSSCLVKKTFVSNNSSKNKRFVETNKISGCGKYAPLNLKANIAEFRIFQSTIVETDFMKNIELVWALHKWTRPESATGSGWRYEDFLTWLLMPQNKMDYPNLITFLKKLLAENTQWNYFAPVQLQLF